MVVASHLRPSPPARLVAVGASAGGLQALIGLLASLEADFPFPILVVQHLAPDHPSQLARLLDARLPFAVEEVKGGVRPLPGRVYIAPPDRHLVFEDGRLRLTRGERVHFSRPSVDVLFRSVAGAVGARAIGVLLSGGGTDGTDGARAIRAAGGRVVAQDRASALNFGMPGSAVAAGAVDLELPLDRIGAYLKELSLEP